MTKKPTPKPKSAPRPPRIINETGLIGVSDELTAIRYRATALTIMLANAAPDLVKGEVLDVICQVAEDVAQGLKKLECELEKARGAPDLPGQHAGQEHGHRPF